MIPAGHTHAQAHTLSTPIDIKRVVSSAPSWHYLCFPQRRLVVTFEYHTLPLTGSPLHLPVTDAPKTAVTESRPHNQSKCPSLNTWRIMMMSERWRAEERPPQDVCSSHSQGQRETLLDPLCWCCWWLPPWSDGTDVGRRPLLLPHGCDSLVLHEDCLLERKNFI